MKIGVIIQARMGSSRLPKKVMKKIQGKSILEHVVERVKQSKLIDEIIIATTTEEKDSIIAVEAIRLGVKVFRGSEEDVLSRYYYGAKKYELNVIVRITSDCPLIDPVVLDDVIGLYLENNYDIVSNASANLEDRTFPRGLDSEVFSFEILESAYTHANQKYEREHVTPYIYENSTQVFYFKNKIDYSKYRLTLDTEEDFLLINEIYKRLYKGKHDFYLTEIINLLESNPELVNINAKIEQKKIK